MTVQVLVIFFFDEIVITPLTFAVPFFLALIVTCVFFLFLRVMRFLPDTIDQVTFLEVFFIFNTFDLFAGIFSVVALSFTDAASVFTGADVGYVTERHITRLMIMAIIGLMIPFIYTAPFSSQFHCDISSMLTAIIHTLENN